MVLRLQNEEKEYLARDSKFTDPEFDHGTFVAYVFYFSSPSLMRYDTIFLDYSSVARSVAKVCKNDGYPAIESHKLMLELYRTLISSRSNVRTSKCCFLQIPQKMLS